MIKMKKQKEEPFGSEQYEEIDGTMQYRGDRFYYLCNLCGINSKNLKKHKCNKMTLVNNKNPRYEIKNLDKYHEDFLKKIIKWQELKIKALTNINSITPNDVDLESF